MKEQIKDTFKGLKSFNWSLFLILCVQLLIPAIYSTVRTYFLSNNVDVSEFDILGQIEWYDLVNETVIAFLIIPQYSLLNRFAKAKSKEEFANFAFKAGMVIALLYAIITTILYFSVLPMIEGLGVAPENIDKTTTYLQLETIAFAVGIIYSYTSVIFIVLNKRIQILALLVAKMFALILCDLFLISKAGIYGVAYSNIVVNSVIGMVAIVILAITKRIRISLPNKEDLGLLKEWGLIGLCSGGQSQLDNLIYVLMVVKMVNSVGNIGSYWLANNFIWNWLLIPMLALNEVIKSDCKNGYKGINQKNYYLITIGVMLVWLCLIPSWLPFLQGAEKLQMLMRSIQSWLSYSGSILPML